MIYKEEVRDLFSVPEDYYLAHCISADFGMGKGIVIEFNKRFDMKNVLMRKYPNYLDNWSWAVPGHVGDCILEGRVLNLITKERYFHKPTYLSMRLALEQMRSIIQKNNIKKIAMPIIGCGLDKLEWSKVSQMVKGMFENFDIEILVCRQ
jgi:hypothetical protein